MRLSTKRQQQMERMERIAIASGIACVVIAVLLSLASCATYEAVTKAPPDFWTTLTGIGMALVHDIGSLLKMIF
jgi:hypothetical protein